MSSGIHKDLEKLPLSYFNIRYLTNYFSKQGIVPQFYFVVDRLDLADQATREFTKRGLKVKRVNSPQELNEKLMLIKLLSLRFKNLRIIQNLQIIQAMILKSSKYLFY